MTRRQEPKINFASAAAIADSVLEDSGDIIVFVGPAVDYGPTGPAFVVATADKDMQPRVDLIIAPTGTREAVIDALLARPPVVVNQCKTGRQLSRLVSSCWPGPSSEAFRRGIERVRP